MKSALIGYTGFVGSNLNSQFNFTEKYNSKNIADIQGKSFDLVVSAATRADMWRINQEEEIDLAEVNALIENLKKIKTKKFVLISSVGVYDKFTNIDEDSEINTSKLLPYGKNRLHLENYIRENFDSVIIRLPGLFGPGLKKNVIYDLLNDNNVGRIHRLGMYQYYNLENIWEDLKKVLDSDISLINFATEPVSNEGLAKYCFGLEFTNEPEDIKPANFDMHTKYADLFNKNGHYIYSKSEELDDIKLFVDKVKKMS